MTSRTPEGKHTKRFIVLKKNVEDTTFVRSYSIPQAFSTKEEAQAAIDALGSTTTQYKIRQK